MNQHRLAIDRPRLDNAARLLAGVACVFILALPKAHAVVDWSTKHRPLTAPNLVSNPEINGISNSWFLSGATATYDSGVSRSAGSGSVKLLRSTFPSPDTLTSFFPAQVQVTPGETYTMSAYAKSSAATGWPSPIIRMTYNYRSATGLHLGDHTVATRWGNSKPDEWEEMNAFIQVPDEINGTPVERLELKFFMTDQVGGIDREVWIDDVYVGLGRGFDQAPTPKTAFNGSQTRVDELGNMEVMRNGAWEDFFPLSMYGDPSRPDWSDYSNQGFNMEMRALSTTNVQKAKAAGMLSGFDVSRYMIDGHFYYNDQTDLANRFNAMKAQGLMNDISLIYWDNENANEQWDVPSTIVDLIKGHDVDANGDRMHPIYSLNGQLGHGRRHLNDQVNLSDVTGTYIGGDNGDPRGRTDQFRVLDNYENQRQPVTFAQINRGVGLDMRPRLFGAIAHGARGFGMWRDTYNTPSLRVENLPWWGDFPNMAAEIDQMMDAGLIQVPHWTDWSIETNANDLIDFGTRDLNGEGYLIASNYDDTSTLVTFTLDNLGYTPVEIRDFFTDAIVATLTGNQFDITIPANGSGVYRLVAPASNPGDFDGDLDVDGDDFLLWQRGGVSGTLAEWQTNYGTIYSSLASTEAIPEPSTALLLLAGTFCLRGILRRTSC